MHLIIAIACHLIVALTAFIYAIAPTGAQETERTPKVQADLISRVTHILPGQPFEIALRQVIEPKWHTYWKNPGDSGEPTRISWELPDGFSASDIAWPIPEAIPVGPLTNYGYSDQVILPVTITPPAALPAGPVTLTATATWLVCEKICIPESAKLSLVLPVRADKTTVPSEFEQIFDMAQRSRPIAIDWPVSAQFGNDLRLDVDAPDLSTERITKVEFFPAEWGFIDHAAPQTLEWRQQGGFTLTLKPGELAAGHINKDIEGILVVTENIGEGTARNGFNLTAQIQTAAARDITEPEAAAVDGISGITIWHAIVFAIFGGIILNAMPCVLPILSLKIMSLAQHSGADAHRGGIAYLAGVMASFAILAAILILLRSLGASLGWGFQFQSPVFVLAMIALFFALGLSMSGVFDIGGSIVGFGETLTRRSGLSGSFFTGMLATIAATPCTAPYMGAAIGYAFVRSDIETFVILMALGLGFAAPIVLLSFTDAARRMLPKPGPWMETLKQALAFPLYATVAWLAWVLSQQSGSDGVLATGIVLTGVALAAWIIGRPMAGLRIRLGLAATILIGAGLLLPGLLRTTPPDTSPSNSTAVDMDGAERFSLDAVEQHRRDGRPVFVNLTAAWCISCKVNERVALSTDGFKTALHTHNIVYLKGDWTNRNDEIAAVLRSFGRAGVPLYLLYPSDTTKQPLVLPQILTEATVIRYFASLSGTTSGP